MELAFFAIIAWNRFLPAPLVILPVPIEFLSEKTCYSDFYFDFVVVHQNGSVTRPNIILNKHKKLGYCITTKTLFFLNNTIHSLLFLSTWISLLFLVFVVRLA